VIGISANAGTWDARIVGILPKFGGPGMSVAVQGGVVHPLTSLVIIVGAIHI